MPARVLLQDFTGVPCVVDLAAMRDGIVALGGDPGTVNPLQPVELVIDHSVQVDHFGRADALQLNADLEYHRNRERYVFLRWGQTAFRNFRVVPPETGIVHQVNIEYLARVVCRDATGGRRARVSGHGLRHRLAHDDGERPRRRRLGRRRHRGGGRDARPAELDADPAGRRLPADGPAAGRRDGDRPRAHDHRSAAQEGRRRQVRRVLRARPGAPDDCRSRHARQHVPRVRRDGRDLPDRRDDARLPALHGPRRGAGGAGRGVREGAGPVPHRRHAGRRATRDTLELDLGTVVPSLAGPRRPQDRVRARIGEDVVCRGAARSAEGREEAAGGGTAAARGGAAARRRRSSNTGRSSSRRSRAARTRRIPA